MLTSKSSLVYFWGQTYPALKKGTRQSCKYNSIFYNTQLACHSNSLHTKTGMSQPAEGANPRTPKPGHPNSNTLSDQTCIHTRRHARTSIIAVACIYCEDMVKTNMKRVWIVCWGFTSWQHLRSYHDGYCTHLWKHYSAALVGNRTAGIMTWYPYQFDISPDIVHFLTLS